VRPSPPRCPVWRGRSKPRETGEGGFLSQQEPFAPDTLLILDFIEFVHAAVAKPLPGKYHEYFNHHHLSFDQTAGQDDFRATVNRMFARNGMWPTRCSRRGASCACFRPCSARNSDEPPSTAATGLLDNMLDECRMKFSDSESAVRREALERLWDGWERLKSMADPNDKKRSVKIIFDAMATLSRRCGRGSKRRPRS
jgi:hypothetical protein